MSDIEIAQKVEMKRIDEIAAILGIPIEDLEPYGFYKTKLPLKYIDDSKIKNNKLVLVTAITPTPAGEGKTTVSIGLTQAMNRLKKKTTVVLREPSLGPVFGIKGGAAGGGYSQVLPMEDINLHFTGDLNAVEKAHNLLSALIDNHLQQGNKLNIDHRTIKIKRVIDMNERALRHIVVGLGGKTQGIPRESGFNITAASEVMATLCLAKDIADLKRKLGNIYIGDTFDGEAIYARDVKAQGAMAALLKDAIKPNLVQTIEGNPAIIHGGPFANIAQGTNSLIATKMGLSLSDFVVTEAGFASELGAEKFFNIKCQYGNLKPNATVLVVTIRALKHHGGVKAADLDKENLEAVKTGMANMAKHIENLQMYNLVPIVAINKFTSDTEAEIKLVKDFCNEMGVRSSVADVWGQGGAGALELAEMVIEEANKCDGCFKPLYSFDQSIEEKIETIATKMYGAARVEYSLAAKKVLKRVAELGLENLPVCIAKTQKSLSDDQYKGNRPEGFTVKIRDVEINSGAGFIVPIAGTIMRMPGLSPTPAAEKIDITDDGVITGLF